MHVIVGISDVFCVTSSAYHDVDFSFSFLHDEGASHSHCFTGVVSFEGVPHGHGEAVLSCSPLGPHLYDLHRHTSRGHNNSA